MGVHQPTTGPAVTEPSAAASGWQQPGRRQQQGRHQRPAVRQVYVPTGNRFSVLQEESAPATSGETAMEPPASASIASLDSIHADIHTTTIAAS